MVHPLNRNAFVWGIHTLCNLHRVPFDAELLLRRFPPPYNLESFQHAAQAYGLKIALQSVQLRAIHPAAMPIIAVLQPDETTSPAKPDIIEPASLDSCSAESSSEFSDTDPQPYRIAFVLKADDERVLLIEPGDTAPQTIPVEEFQSQSTGQVLMTIKAPETVEEDNKPQHKFGFRWFIPELLKHKNIWREILIASFAIQLVALATPLCTQVIIDKVVVHHSISTLIVVAVALGIFLIFNAAMGWVRQYLVLHTGNRIDAVLGHKVFDHMLHLPMRYFEHRPTGTLVAAWQQSHGLLLCQ